MSSLEERLEAAMCPDSTIAVPAQHELVEALLNRRFRRSLPSAGAPIEQLCANCHVDLDETGYCDMCGHQTRRTR